MNRPGPAYHVVPRSRSAARAGLAASRLDVGHVSLEVVEVDPGVEVPRHAHDRTHLCYLIEGELLEREGRGERPLVRSGLRLSPGGDSHAIRAGPSGFACLVIAIADEALGAAPLRAPTARRWLEPGPASGLAARLLDELRGADDASPVSADMLATELIALLQGSPDRPPRALPSWLERVRERLEDDPRRLPSLTELAAQAGVSRSHVARGFRRRYGRTVGDHVRALRVERARKLLTTTDLALARVAFEAGFADQSHMNRLVARRLGVTPGRLRAAAKGDATIVQDGDGAPARS